ncbi:MAG: class I SAM-dependent methyltransferase, partial [Nitrospirota bacterium]
ILSLSFGNGAFNYIFCWGVLMHIPDVEKAIAELARVLKPGGMLIIEEGNMNSLQSIVLSIIRLLTGMKKAEFKRTSCGIERWKNTPSGPLFVRQANIGWLIKTFEKEGLFVRKRIAAEFTELYRKVPFYFIERLIHFFNRFWFRYLNIPYPACENILIFQKIK